EIVFLSQLLLSFLCDLCDLCVLRGRSFFSDLLAGEPSRRSRDELSRWYRLDENIGTPGSQAALSRLVVVVPGQRDDRLSAGGAQRLDEQQPVSVWQSEIEERESGRVRADDAECFGNTSGGRHAVASRFKEQSERARHQLAVLDDEDVRLDCHAKVRSVGRR